MAPAAVQARSGVPSILQQEQEAAPAASAAAPAPTERLVGILEPGKPVERELQGGQTDTYTIELKAGQFLHVIAEQKGIDVVLQLIGPDGKTIVEADSPNGAWGPEPASLIADTSGTFVARVKSFSETSTSGKYQITVTDLRLPRPEDEKRIAAERAFFAAVRLFNKPGKENAQKSSALLENALPLWRDLNDRYEEAMSLLALGSLHDTLGEKQKALDYYNQALPLERAVGNRSDEATTLHNIGAVYFNLGEKQNALDYYNQALPLRRAAGDRSGEAQTLNNIGVVYSALGERQKALVYYNQALPLRRAVGDRSGEALTLHNIGKVYDDLGEKQKALDYYNQALPLRRAVGDRSGEAVTLNNIGLVYSDLGEKQKALEYYNQALPLHRAVGNRSGEALTLNNISLVYSDLGEKQRALEYYNQALSLERAVGNRSDEAATLNNIGKVYSDLGERQKALDYYNQALPLERAAGDRREEAATLSNIGRVYSDLAEEQKALEYFAQALPLERAVGERAGEAATLSNIGKVYDDLGDKQKALEYFAQALPLDRAVGDRRGEAVTLNNIGSVYDDLREKRKALEYYNQALPLQHAVGDRRAEAVTLNNIGSVYSDLGEKQKALEYYNRSLPLKRAVGDRSGEAVSLNNIGLIYYDLGEKQKALEYYSQSLALARAVHDPLVEGNVLGLLMVHWESEKNLALAIFFGKQAVNTYQQVRSNIRGLEKELQGSFLHSHSQIYRKLADLLIDQGRLAEAIQVLDLLKDEEYFEYTGRRTRGSSGATTQLAMAPSEAAFWQDYQKIQDEITAAGDDAAALSAKKGLSPEEQQRLDEDNRKLDLADKALQKNYDALFAEWKQTGNQESAQRQLDDLRKTQLPELQALVGQLGPGTVGLYTVVAENEFHIIVVTSNAIVARQFSITAKDLNGKIAKAVQVLDADPASTSRPDPKIILKQLYDILIAPIEKDLAGAHAQTLMWHLDGGLQYIPMAALYDGKQFLVERYSTAVFNSTAHLNEPPKVESWRGLGLGDCRPASDLGLDDALLSVPGELRGIIRGPGAGPETGIMPGELMLDETFTREAMIHALRSHYPVIHIASHFVLSPGNEGESFILLGPAAQGANRRLTLDDIAKREFSFAGAELVTLSACQTAAGGPSQNGKEMDSLAEDIRQKGAKAVMASLWHVDDDSTGLLMADFYHRWIDTHVTKAEALRQAQLDLLYGRRAKTTPPADPTAAAEAKRCATASDQTISPSDPNASHADPNYWAPFFLYGNW
ncbi:MAG TPA: tetratricopeptide repeat protein, partial [Candidatus Acidoferrales bacterium]|nr:tetratricopeptide repeat protein [Candidatus Acidoferrales bacterium]